MISRAPAMPCEVLLVPSVLPKGLETPIPLSQSAYMQEMGVRRYQLQVLLHTTSEALWSEKNC